MTVKKNDSLLDLWEIENLPNFRVDKSLLEY